MTSKEKFYPAIQLTSACNKQCSACLRDANRSDQKTSWKTFSLYLEDLRTISSTRTIANQFVTGGEPTIWKDAERDYTDILVALDGLDKVETIVMPSNGKVFENLSFARTSLKKLSNSLSKKIVLGISIAGYQENFSESEGCKALNNLIELADDPEIKITPIILVTLSKNDDISDRIRKKYPKIFQRVTPLAPMGGAEDMTDECPSLSLSGTDKNSLGSFLPYFMNDVCGKLKISQTEFFSMKNSTIMDRLSLFNHCGASPFIDDRWHYCLPFKDDTRFDLCDIGGFSEKTMENFLYERKMLQSIRQCGIITTVQNYSDRLTAGCREKLKEILEGTVFCSVAYRGCMICKKLYDIGFFSTDFTSQRQDSTKQART
ncbi:MAG: hypothetical protein HQK54_07925 [Oligoflexales bacterium]|nr:hypothetical protein [Oligoflexales bacterium]